MPDGVFGRMIPAPETHVDTISVSTKVGTWAASATVVPAAAKPVLTVVKSDIVD